MLNENNKFARSLPISWKIVTIFMMLNLGLLSLPAVIAQNEVVVHIPVIFNPPIPGSTGVLAYTVSSGTKREIYTINANGSDMRQLTNNDAVDDMPAWSADGAVLAFTSDRREKDHFEIYTINADGSGVKRLTDSQWDDNSPNFSPDGSKIVFASNRSGNFQIFVMNSDGSGQTPLTGDSYTSGQPEWSPDGTKIAYSSNQDSAFSLDIYVMGSDGSNKKRITSADDHDFAPAWSPDGRQIAFTSLRDGARRIYVMDADGSGQEKLTTFYSDWPDWSPDGARLVFTREEGNNSSRRRSELGPEAAGLLLAHSVGVWAADGAENDRNLYTIKADGTDLQPFTQTPTLSEDRASWGP
jgi:TolB protein